MHKMNSEYRRMLDHHGAQPESSIAQDSMAVTYTKLSGILESAEIQGLDIRSQQLLRHERVPHFEFAGVYLYNCSEKSY